MTNLPEQKKEYERFEFLGDRVLNLIVSQYLLKKHEDSLPGDLTKRLIFASNDNLEELFERLPDEIKGDILKIKKKYRPDAETPNANAIEAYIGQYFSNKGYDATKSYVENIFAGHIDSFDPKTDYISILKEHSDAEKQPQPDYKYKETGKGQNDPERFLCQVSIGKELRGSGNGPSHPKAKQSAAHEALKELGLGN